MVSRSQLIASTLGALALHVGASAGEPGVIAHLAVTNGLWQVWTVGPDGRGARQVTRSSYEKASVSWFPNGKALLVNSLEGRLFRVDPETGEETRVLPKLVGVTDAVVSPDGRRIVFSRSTGNSVDANEIWTAALDGSGLQQMTRMRGLQHQPRVSADGRWIYFLSGDGGQSHDIWRMSPLTGGREKVSGGARYHFELALAPDGRIAFSSNREGDYDLYAEQPGGDERRLTHDPGLDGHPSWSPDGQEIVFHSTRAGGLDLWRVAAAGGEPVRVTRHPEGARSPEWWHPRGEAP